MENTDVILVSFHILLGLVIAHLVFTLEEVQYPFASEVYSRPFLSSHYLLYTLDGLTILSPKKDSICVVVALLKGVTKSYLFFVLRLEQPAILDAIAEGMGKVHAIFGKKSHAFPLGHEDFVEARSIWC